MTSPAPSSSSPREALTRRRARERGAARGEAEPELAADLLAEVARGEVLARERAALGLPQEPLVEGRRPVEQLEEPLAPLPRSVLLGRGLLVLELHAEPVAEPLDRADEVEVLFLLDERDRVAALAAAEALEGAAVGRDAEARRPLLVKRAEADVTAPRLAQARVPLDERDDVGRCLDGLDRGVLDPRHQRFSAYASAKRSVIPATYSTISSAPSPPRGEVIDDAVDRLVRAAMLLACVVGEVDALEHEVAQAVHRPADLLALADVAGGRRRLDQVVDEAVDPPRPGRPEQLDLLLRQVVLGEQAVAERVVDVVVDVGDAVDEAHDLPLERVRLDARRCA